MLIIRGGSRHGRTGWPSPSDQTFGLVMAARSSLPCTRASFRL